METLILVWIAGGLISTLHMIYHGLEEFFAVVVGAFLSWFYWGLWFGNKDLAWLFGIIILTLVL